MEWLADRGEFNHIQEAENQKPQGFHIQHMSFNIESPREGIEYS